MSTVSTGVPATTFEDLRQAALAWRLWHSLAWNDVKQQFKRSRLGILWAPLLTGIHITVLTFIFSFINGADAEEFAFHVGAGYIIWRFMSELMLEGTRLFVRAEQMLRNSIIPRSLFVFRLVQRQIIQLLLNLTLLPLIFLRFWRAPGPEAIFLLVSFPILLLTAPAVGLLTGLLGLRLPDLGQLVAVMIRISFYATPIFWLPERLGPYAYLVWFNPFYHFVQLVRLPIQGEWPDVISLGVALAIAVSAWLAAILLYRAWRAKISYWL
jgi:ABC-type polysaccharide/polyol phosphate export permease